MSRAGPGGRGGPGLPGPGAGGAPGDPGLARARTSLAWTRTALSFAAIGGIILKRDLAAGFVVLALSCLVWLVGRLALVPARTGQVRARPGPQLVISIAVTGVAIVALMLALLGPQTPGLRLRP
jgi:uncharacterized membrane protein YidH (DUF202 family)